MPPAVIAAVIGAGATAASTIAMKHKSKEQKQVEQSASEISRAEAESIKRRNQLMDELTDFINNKVEGNPPPLFQFPESAGGPALPTEFLEGIGFKTPFNLKRDVAALGSVSPGITAQQLGIGAQERSSLASTLGSMGQGIAFLLAQELFKPRASSDTGGGGK